jgi:hypothetical protein
VLSTRLIVFGIIAVFAVLPTFAQVKEISGDEYYSNWRSALQKSRGIDLRNVSKTETYKDGKLTDTEEWQYEYVLPDRIHYVHVRNVNGKVRRTEQIDIGSAKYCKQDDDGWKQIASPCIGGSATGGTPPESERFSKESTLLDGEKLTLYKHYSTSRRPWLKGKEAEILFYSENSFWLNDKGLMVRQERRSGRVEPISLDRKVIDTYEFAPKNLKIQAPNQ